MASQPELLSPQRIVTDVREPIYVTRSFVPPEEEYLYWLRKALESRVLTNNGPIHRELEETLRTRFDVPHLRLMANGTLALQLAIRALGITGRVITTPYSYVATTSAILWEGCAPVFVDIRPDTLKDGHASPGQRREVIRCSGAEDADPPLGRDRDGAAIEREGQAC